MTDFFISYTRVDRLWAEWIAWQLEEAGYTTVIQAWDFRPGANFPLAMQHAAAESERTIAVLSPAYLQSGFTAAEWAAAFAKDPTGRQGLLLPVRIHDCELRGLLPQIFYIDLVGLEAGAARERLLAGILQQRAKPTRAPGFPGPSPRPGTARPLFPGAMPQNIPFNLAQAGSASKFSGKIEEFFEEYLITETGLPTVPFGGRDEDIALLDAWLDDATAPPRYLLTAPAGRGKSALLVRWLQHLQKQGRVGQDTPASWHLVFVPISIRFETHRPEIFYEALAARLAAILGEELQPTHTDKSVYYADHCRILASTAVAQGQRILIVLDGIDEALGERFDAHWFPRNPGTKLRLVLSARWLAGDLDSSGWQARLGWERNVRVQLRELPVLARDGVRDLLLKMGAQTDVLASRPDIVDRLHELAEGEPLVLRYYAEDIWGMREAAPRLTIDDLAQLRPGLGVYFARWLDDQERLWAGTDNPVDRRRVDVLLVLLACAHGRLTGADLRALLTECGEGAVGGRFLEQLKAIQRFVIGLDRLEAETAGYILSHPKLGIHLREEHFDPEYIQAIQATFVRWGRKTVERLNSGMLRPEQTPVYLLQYHTQHLQKAAPMDAFLELVEYGWLRAWETFEGGYRGFSRDVRLAYEALSRAHAADQPRFAQRLRCQLVLSSIHNIGTHTPWQLLVAAFKARVLTYQQVGHWLEFKPSADRAQALAALAPHLPAEVLAEALLVARTIEDGYDRAQALAALAPHLPAEVLAEALLVARTIEDGYDRAQALAALAPHLPAEVLAEALLVARTIEDGYDRAQALAALAPHLPAELGAEVLAETLLVARTIEDGYDRAQALAALAPHLPAEVLAEALLVARTIEDSDARVQALEALAPHLPAELGAEALAEALLAVRTIEDSATRTYALGELAPHLPAEVLAEALLAVRTIEDSAARMQALAALAPHLPAGLGAEALLVARTIEDSAARMQALAALAPHLPGEMLAEALLVARTIEDSAARMQVLAALAPLLSGNLLQQGFEELLDVLPRCRRDVSLFAVSTFFPFLEELQGPKGLEEVRRAIVDTTRWFP